MLATYPTGVPNDAAVFGPDGSLYVTDYYNNQVLHYDANGAALPSFGAGHLNKPQDLIFGPDGNLYVGDAFGDVQEFSPSGAFPPHLHRRRQRRPVQHQGTGLRPRRQRVRRQPRQQQRAPLQRHDRGLHGGLRLRRQRGSERARGPPVRPRRQPVRDQLLQQQRQALQRHDRGLHRDVRERRQPHHPVRPSLRRGGKPGRRLPVRRPDPDLRRHDRGVPRQPGDRPDQPGLVLHSRRGTGRAT